MKKLFLLVSAFLAFGINHASAQINQKQKELITLGGNADKSTLSAAQVIDYPMLIVNNPNTHISNFQMSIRTEDGSKIAGPFVSQSAKFSSDMVVAIESFKGLKSILKFEHIIMVKEGKPLKEESLEFNINQ
jgi:hypothetical protein